MCLPVTKPREHGKLAERLTVGVAARLNDIVTRAFRETWETRKQHQTSMRMAAYGIAVQRVAEATITRGLYP